MLKIIVIFLLLVSLLLLCVAAAGSIRWSAGTRLFRERIERGRLPPSPVVVDFREIEGLPPPVQRFFRTVLTEGMPMVTGVRIGHRGSFNMGETGDRWRPFTSDQVVVTRSPGFDWDARISLLPGVPVRVHDSYGGGEGILTAALFGLIPVADVRGGGSIAEGELMRFLAEAAWYPTALLPSQGARWEKGDERSARVTLTDGGCTVSLLVHFGQEGWIGSVRADARGRSVGNGIVPTPWVGRFGGYQRVGGMLIPMEGEVAWSLPGGEKPYWRGRITRITHEFAR